MKRLIIAIYQVGIIGCLYAQIPSSNQNYIMETLMRDSGINTLAQVNALTVFRRCLRDVCPNFGKDFVSGGQQCEFCDKWPVFLSDVRDKYRHGSFEEIDNAVRIMYTKTPGVTSIERASITIVSAPSAYTIGSFNQVTLNAL